MSTFRDRNRNTSSKRLLVLIFAILIVDGIIGSLVYPVLPDFFRTSHNPELLFGLSTVIFALMQMLFAPVRMDTHTHTPPEFSILRLHRKTA